MILVVFSVLTNKTAFKKRKKRLRYNFKPILVGATILVVGLGLGSYLIVSQSKPQQVAVVTGDDLFGWKYPTAAFPSTGSGSDLAYSDIRDPGGIPQGLPVRLKIPTIGVDSAIEDALITADGRMDVPEGSKNVAWFALGPHPGQEGSAVIGGHFGISNGVPFVFYDLDKMKVGDKVYVVDDRDDTLTFVVRSISSFDRNADATTVFTSDDGLAHLNLITCEGIWNQINDTYPQRLVVFTDAVATDANDATVPTPTPAVPTPTPSTPTTPSPTPTPTPEPTLPPTDSDGATSPTPTPTTPEPTLPTPTTPTATSSTKPLAVTVLESLFATQLDAFISLFLVTAIGLLTGRLIWRALKRPPKNLRRINL